MKTLILIFTAILLFSCKNVCKRQSETFNKLTKPILVKDKFISNTSNNGYYLRLIDAKGITLTLSAICSDNDSLIINYNKGDTIK